MVLEVIRLKTLKTLVKFSIESKLNISDFLLFRCFVDDQFTL